MLTRLAVIASLVLSVAVVPPAAAQYRVGYGWRGGSPPADPTITPYFGYMNLGHYVDGPLGTSASGGEAALVGAQVMLPLTPYFALVGNAAHANSNLVFFEPTGGGSTVGNSGVWLFDGDLQLSSPFRGSGGHWIEPFVQLGAGAMRYSTQNDLGDASATNFAFNAGIGLDYAISRNIGIQILGKDYIGHWNVTPQFPFQSGDRFTNNYGITAGLSLGLGR
jgi:hypothetical protein